MAELDSGLGLDDFQKEWVENVKNPVPLHPELAEYVVRADPDKTLKWDVLKHPLVFGVPYISNMNFLYNQQYETKIKAVRECVSQENWSQYIFLHERPYRFDAFDAVVSYNKIDGPMYWDLLSHIWSDSENLWQVGYKRIRKILSRHPKYRDHFMDERDKILLRFLPD